MLVIGQAMYRLERDQLQLVCSKVNCDHRCYLFHQPIGHSEPSSRRGPIKRLRMFQSKNSLIKCSASESEGSEWKKKDDDNRSKPTEKYNSNTESMVTLDDIIETAKRRFSSENEIDRPDEIRSTAFWQRSDLSQDSDVPTEEVTRPETVLKDEFQRELLDSDEEGFEMGEPPSTLIDEDDTDSLISAMQLSTEHIRLSKDEAISHAEGLEQLCLSSDADDEIDYSGNRRYSYLGSLNL